MINIRAFRPEDLDELKRIHHRFFSDEFDLPKFMEYICAFTIEDDKGTLTMGGIRPIAECVAVTNMDRGAGDRLRALYKLMDASTFVCRKSGFDQMYVWSQNPKWTRRMKRNGFRYPDGQSLILDL